MSSVKPSARSSGGTPAFAVQVSGPDCSDSTTLNNPNPVTVVPLVVTETSRAPNVAFGAIFRLIVRLVGALTMIEVIVIPGPKLTLEKPEKPVFDP